MKILTVDIGLYNLALVKADLEEDYLSRERVILETEIVLCDHIDITSLIYTCNDSECQLHHDKVICDYTSHLFKKYKTDFEEADLIYIEQQPPCGLVVVEQLIMREYRDKTHLTSPTAMLNYFGILQFEYEERKIHTEKIAMNYLNSFKVFMFNERRHDMADAFCILYYEISKMRNKHKKKMEDIEFKLTHSCFISNMQKYKYNPA